MKTDMRTVVGRPLLLLSALLILVIPAVALTMPSSATSSATPSALTQPLTQPLTQHSKISVKASEVHVLCAVDEADKAEGEEEEAWGGTDDAACEAIEQVNPDYEPWFSPVWEPPSGEIESFLFSLQAAIGAVIIGFVIGYYKGKKDALEHRRK